MPSIGKGRHTVHVLASALGKAGTGTAQVSITFGNEAGETITSYHFLTDNALPYTNETLARLGWDVEARGYRYDELNKGQESPLVGAETEITVVEEVTPSGETKLKVKFVGSGGIGAKPMDEADAAILVAEIARKARALKGLAPTAARTTPPPINPANKPPF